MGELSGTTQDMVVLTLAEAFESVPCALCCKKKSLRVSRTHDFATSVCVLGAHVLFQNWCHDTPQIVTDTERS